MNDGGGLLAASRAAIYRWDPPPDWAAAWKAQQAPGLRQRPEQAWRAQEVLRVFLDGLGLRPEAAVSSAGPEGDIHTPDYLIWPARVGLEVKSTEGRYGNFALNLRDLAAFQSFLRQEPPTVGPDAYAAWERNWLGAPPWSAVIGVALPDTCGFIRVSTILGHIWRSGMSMTNMARHRAWFPTLNDQEPICWVPLAWLSTARGLPPEDPDGLLAAQAPIVVCVHRKGDDQDLMIPRDLHLLRGDRKGPLSGLGTSRYGLVLHIHDELGEDPWQTPDGYQPNRGMDPRQRTIWVSRTAYRRL